LTKASNNPSFPAPIFAALVGGILPLAYVALKRRKRLRRFEEHFPEAIDLLNRALRAGHAFTTGMGMIATEAPEPIAEEFRTTFEEQNFGLPLRDVLQNLSERVPLIDVRFFVTALLIQKETGGFTEFVPLGFIHSQTKLFKIGGARAGHSPYEDLIVHALARVLLHGHIPNIQVSWVKLGFEQSLACLEAGANDFGGTLMEESISKAAGANFGEYVSPGEFRALIRTIGRIPAERSTTCIIRKVFEHPDAEEVMPSAGMPIFGAPTSHHTQVTSTGY